MVVPIVFLVACSVALTVAAGPVFDVVEAAAVVERWTVADGLRRHAVTTLFLDEHDVLARL